MNGNAPPKENTRISPLTNCYEFSQKEQGSLKNWGPPIYFEDRELPPFDSKIIPGWAGNFFNRLAEFIETPVELTSMLGLAAISACLSRFFEVEVKPGYIEPINIWVVAALESGNRKTEVLNKCTQPLLEWQRIKAIELQPRIAEVEAIREVELVRSKHLQGRLAKEGKSEKREELLTEIQENKKNLPIVPEIPQLWTADVTVEKLAVLLKANDERIAIISDEGGIFDLMGGLYSQKIPNFDLYLKGHAGSPYRSDRIGRETIFLSKPAITIGISPQPAVLKDASKIRGAHERGLLPRFLYVMPKSPLGKRTGVTKAIQDEITMDYRNGIFSLLNHKPPTRNGVEISPFELTLDDHAYRHWLEFYQFTEEKLADGGKFENMRAWGSKLPGAVARIAGIFHLIKFSKREPNYKTIDADSMLRAISLANILEEHAILVFEYMGSDPVFENAKRVLAWFRRKKLKIFTKRQCHHALQRYFKRVNELTPALELLKERIFIAEIAVETKPCRPSQVYEVNPHVLKNEKI